MPHAVLNANSERVKDGLHIVAASVDSLSDEASTMGSWQIAGLSKDGTPSRSCFNTGPSWREDLYVVRMAGRRSMRLLM